jgi:hypothetical protein
MRGHRLDAVASGLLPEQIDVLEPIEPVAPSSVTVRGTGASSTSPTAAFASSWLTIPASRAPAQPFPDAKDADHKAAAKRRPGSRRDDPSRRHDRE